MTPPGRCHPPMSRPLAPCDRRTCVNRATSSVRPTGADDARIVRLNRERPHFKRFGARRSLPVQRCKKMARAATPSTEDAATVLGGVKGARADARRLCRP